MVRFVGAVLLIFYGAGCTFAPTVKVPDKGLQEAATAVSAGVKEAGQEAGKELGAELGQAGVKAREQYGSEIREASNDLTLAARSVRDLAESAKSSPAVFGDAIAQRLMKEAAIQRTLRRVEMLALSQERLAEAGMEAPKLLAAKIGELQSELMNKEGFLSQQRAVILDELRNERQAMTEAIRRERIDLMKDVDALTLKAVDHAGAQVRKIVEEALGLTIVLALVLLGLPFAAGFLVGRMSGKS